MLTTLNGNQYGDFTIQWKRTLLLSIENFLRQFLLPLFSICVLNVEHVLHAIALIDACVWKQGLSIYWKKTMLQALP